MADSMDIEILPDGSVKVTTSKISGPNHMNAEALLRDMGKELGGKTTRTRRKEGHTHTHGRQTHRH